MVKVVVNKCFGGFSLSPAALETYATFTGTPISNNDGREIPRHDPALVRVVETMGAKANGEFAELHIVDIESDRYRIRDYDGQEWTETPESIDDWVRL